MNFKLTRVSETEIVVDGEDGFQITLLDNPMAIKIGEVVVPLEQLLQEDRDARRAV